MIRHRTLLAILTGCMMSLTGCQASWQDRVDSRPMKYGSFSDKFAYWTGGPCDGYRPAYHCGSPDGLFDRKAVHHASISSANQALDEQFTDGVSRDFRYGFQQAFLDIANGGSGALPAVPPPRYWTAAYRTTWGHNKARDWFEGYEAGANAAKCSALREAQSVPTAAYRGPDNQVSIGLNGGGSSFGSAPPNSAPMAAPASGWNPQSMSPYPVSPYSASPHSMSPYSTNPYPISPYSASPYSASPYQAAPNPYPTPTQPPVNPWPQMQPQMPPQSGYPASGPMMSPSGPMMNQSVPPMSPMANPQFSGSDALSGRISPTSPWSSLSPSSDGHSVAPGVPYSPAPPSPSPNMVPANSAPPSSALPTSNPWSRFSGFGPSGFRSEGASR